MSVTRARVTAGCHEGVDGEVVAITEGVEVAGDCALVGRFGVMGSVAVTFAASVDCTDTAIVTAAASASSAHGRANFPAAAGGGGGGIGRRSLINGFQVKQPLARRGLGNPNPEVDVRHLSQWPSNQIANLFGQRRCVDARPRGVDQWAPTRSSP